MKNILLFSALFIFTFGFSQTTLIPDPNFEQALIDLGYDTAPIDGQVLTANIEDVTNLDVSSKNIADLTGIEGFTALTELICRGNQLISLDLSNNLALSVLGLSANELTSLDVSNNIALTQLDCTGNELTNLNVTNNTALGYLECRYNDLASLDLSNNILLYQLECYGNQLTNLDMTANPALLRLYCFDNQLTSLDLSNNIILEFLYTEQNQLIGLLDLSNNIALTKLRCFENKIEILNIKNGNNTNVTNFNASTNPDLYCIVVDDISYSTTNWTNIDPASTFVNNETDCEALSLVDNNFELEVTIYPNPTDNYLFIEGNENPISITIYNLLGAKVIAKSNTDKIDVSELSKGVYIINISDGVGQTNRKFIKN